MLYNLHLALLCFVNQEYAPERLVPISIVKIPSRLEGMREKMYAHLFVSQSELANKTHCTQQQLNILNVAYAFNYNSNVSVFSTFTVLPHVVHCGFIRLQQIEVQHIF